MSTTTVHKTSVKPQENWQQLEYAVTHNDVIEAYLHGKEVGRDLQKLAMNNLFQANLTKAQENSEKLNALLKEIGININTIHLKADNVSDFLALVVAKPEDYISDNFLKAISLSRDIKTYSHSKDFTINFNFTYLSDTLNEGCLLADGYFLKYDANA